MARRTPGTPALAALGVILCTAPLANARDGDDESGGFLEELDAAVDGSRFWFKTRYRFELVDQQGFVQDAQASTLRTVLGLETGTWNDASVLLEFEDVSPVGEDEYDDTINGKVAYPVVADPDSAEVNQAFVRYAGFDDVEARFGRQRITLDDHRFVGNVGWRQNEQTFDALRLTCNNVEDFTFDYSYVGNVNRIVGDGSAAGDAHMSSHLLNVSTDVLDCVDLTVFGYLLDYDYLNTQSTDTFGVRASGRQELDSFDVLYAGSWATQSDGSGNPNMIDADYVLAELGAAVSGVTVKVGQEVLEGTGVAGQSFQTPLATGHKFNGWADRFLGTPAAGLEDVYVSASTTIGPAKLLATMHRFAPDVSGQDFGDELDLQVTCKVSDSCTVGLKMADFGADDPAYVDVTKTWAWFSWAP